MGSSAGIAEAVPTLQQRDVEGPSDHQLVAALRRGDDRAFERLYSRYHRRIQAYVLGMCKDHARAEDITQEIFVAALRRMRETERPIAFKPWIYEIAKNACIDQHRRSRRAEEVSLQAEDALAPADFGRLVNTGPTPDMAVVVKQDLDHLCGAFGGLSETHHEILVMRELEGLSYREIGERLGMSRPAVESTLFRARRRLTEEFDELVSGERCLRIQGIIATAGRGRLGARDSRRLARHVAHCQPCRREALAAGFDAAELRAPLRTRAAEKVAALLPFPLLGRRFTRGGADDAAISGGWAAHLPVISDQLGAGWTKAAAAAAVLLAGVGAGVGTRAATSSPGATARPAATLSHSATAVSPASAAAVISGAGLRHGAAGGLAARHAGARYGARVGVVRGAVTGDRDSAAGGRSSAPTSSAAGAGAAPVAPGTLATPVPSPTKPGGGSGAPLTIPTPRQAPVAPQQIVSGAADTAATVVGQAQSEAVGAAEVVGSTVGAATQPIKDAADSVTNATSTLVR